MRILLDVGAHEGQTLAEVLDPRYGFDRVYAFEPMPEQYATLVDRYSDEPRAVLRNYGLAATSGRMPVYGSNVAMEASLYPAKRDVDQAVSASCLFVEASCFLAPFAATDEIIVKLNCEGAEVEILDNLMDSGEVWKIANVMVDFDVRKIPGMEGEERRTLDRFAAIGFDRFSLCEDVMRGDTHAARIAAWLDGLR